MWIVFLLLYILLIHFFFMGIKKNNSVMELNFLMLGIFFYIAFRDYSVGADTAGYASSYIRHGSMSFQELYLKESFGNEVGYLFVTKLLYLLFPQKRALLVFQAIVVVICNGYFIKKTCGKDYFLAILGFLAFGMFGFHITGIRQSIAMSICILSYPLMQEKKNILSILLIIVASTFHFSALVFLLVFIFAKIWKKHNSLFTTAILTIIFILVAQPLQSFLSTLREKWEMYETIEGTNGGLIFFAVLLLISLFAEFNKKNFSDKQLQNVRVNYLSLILWGGRLVSRTFERPCLYFLPTSLPILIEAVTAEQDRKTRLVLYCIVVFLVSALFLYRFSSIDFVFSFV